jgi:hypothetical protein
MFKKEAKTSKRLSYRTALKNVVWWKSLGFELETSVDISRDLFFFLDVAAVQKLLQLS